MMASIDVALERQLATPLRKSPIFALTERDDPNLCRFESERYAPAGDKSASAKRAFVASLGLVDSQRMNGKL
jgi:hypothetical protein